MDNFLIVRLKKSISNAKPSSYNQMNTAGHSFSGIDHALRGSNHTPGSMDVQSIPEHYAQINNHNMALKQMISKHNTGSINYLQVQ